MPPALAGLLTGLAAFVLSFVLVPVLGSAVGPPPLGAEVAGIAVLAGLVTGVLVARRVGRTRTAD